MSLSKELTLLKNNATNLAKLMQISESSVNKFIDRVRVFEYMSPKFPTFFDELRTKRLLKFHDDPEKLASELRFFSVTDEKKKIYLEKKQKTFEENIESYAKQKELFEKGLNGYGHQMMNLHIGHERAKRILHEVVSHRLLASMRINENPQIIFDLSLLCGKNQNAVDIKKIKRQIQIIFSINDQSRDPWLINFAGFNPDSPMAEIFLRGIGRMNSCQQPGLVPPEVETRLPHEYLPSDKKVVYLSYRSKRYLEGPLNADYYVINGNMDRNKESFLMAKRAGAAAYNVPIQRYVKWTGGPLFLSFPVLINILKEVHSSRGDWKTAILNNVPIRQQNEEIKNSSGYIIRRETIKKKHEDFLNLIDLMRHVQ